MCGGKKLKTIIGQKPKQNTKIGNYDCIFIEHSSLLIKTFGKYVHAIQCARSITEVNDDTLYVEPSISLSLNITKNVKLTLPDNILNTIYPEFLAHLNRPDVKMYNIRKSDRLSGSVNAIAFSYNNNVAFYYLPDFNSWICGDIGWHPHYVSYFVEPLFPQIMDELQLPEIDNAITQKKKLLNKIEVLVGCDPEFELLKNNRILKANRHINNENMYNSSIGVDGAACQVEIRPPPGSPAQVTRNIKGLIKKFSEDYSNYDLSTQGNKYPLGGHIHIGIGFEYLPVSDLISLLDDFVGRPTLDLSGNARSDYKRLGAARKQPHGFEYRSTPAAVFAEPHIANITMKMMKNLCEKYFNEERISYNDQPTIDDYINICGLTKKQANYFLDFCNNYSAKRNSIRASWKVPITKSLPTEYPIVCEFQGSWDKYVSNNIETLLDEFCVSMEGFKVHFYILPEVVGDVTCTIPVMGIDQFINSSICTWQGKTMQIGLSSRIANRGMTSLQYHNLTIAIISMIKDKIRSLPTAEEV